MKTHTKHNDIPFKKRVQKHIEYYHNPRKPKLYKSSGKHPIHVVRIHTLKNIVELKKSQTDKKVKCLSCPPNVYTKDQNGNTIYIDPTRRKYFGETSEPNCNCPRGPIYNGLLNTKKTKMSASLNTDHKKNVQLFQDEIQNFDCFKENLCKKPNNNHNGVGGPGKKIPSMPRYVTRIVTGNKARIISPLVNGVDKKHGSYERYLMKKKAVYQQKEHCNKCIPLWTFGLDRK